MRAGHIIDINIYIDMMPLMRTTLTIDDDVAARIEHLRRHRGASLREMIDVLLRDGLERQSQRLQSKAYRLKPRALGLRAGVDATKLNQLADELDVERFVSVASTKE